MRRTPYLARARSSNLLDHVLVSMTQAALGKPVKGALGRPGDALLVLTGHDTNLSNLSGMLGLSWRLPGYQPDDTPPGGALIFSLWHGDAGEDRVTARYVAQSADQMRNAGRLTRAAPPVSRGASHPWLQKRIGSVRMLPGAASSSLLRRQSTPRLCQFIKCAVSEVRSRIEMPRADTRGPARSARPHVTRTAPRGPRTDPHRPRVAHAKLDSCTTPYS